MSTEPITIDGAKKLQDELALLTGSKRQEVIKAIAEARAHGDLKENAEYHAAKEEQSHNEGRIQEIQSLLANAEIIDITSKLYSAGMAEYNAKVGEWLDSQL